MKLKYSSILFTILILSDQFIKVFVDTYVNLSTEILIIPGVNLTKVYNSGISFGFLYSKQILIIVLTLLSFVLIIYLLFEYRYDKFLSIGLIFILGGAIGNFIDRVSYGYVIDYIHLNIFSINFPIFNLADIYINIGFICIVIIYLYSFKNKKIG